MEKEVRGKKGLRRKKWQEEGKEQARGKKWIWEQKDCAELKNEWNRQLSLFLLTADH